MYISDFFYIWKTNRMTLFCNLLMERLSYMLNANSNDFSGNYTQNTEYTMMTLTNTLSRPDNVELTTEASA